MEARGEVWISCVPRELRVPEFRWTKHDNSNNSKLTHLLLLDHTKSLEYFLRLMRNVEFLISPFYHSQLEKDSSRLSILNHNFIILNQTVQSLSVTIATLQHVISDYDLKLFILHYINEVVMSDVLDSLRLRDSTLAEDDFLSVIEGFQLKFYLMHLTFNT